MEIFTESPIAILPFAGQVNYPKHSLTLIVKATLDISHKNIARLAEEQLLPTADEYYLEDETQSGSLYYASDFSFFKPRADVLLSGKCYVPGGHSVAACPVSFQIGNYKKSLNVYGSRYWRKIHFSPQTTESEPFKEMDLRYERSFGGKNYALNPIGRGAAKADISIADNVLPVPNIQDPNKPITSPFEETSPAGFGPLDSTWKQRQDKLGTYDKAYLKTRWPWFAEDFDWSHFNAAPSDQQIEGYLKGDEKLVFENMHRKFPVYETQLPGIRPRCFARKQAFKDAKRYFEEVDLNLDTLWIDMEQEKMVLIWRGWTEVMDEDFDEIKQIFLMQESLHNAPAEIDECYSRFKKAQAAENGEIAEPEEKPESKPKKKKSANVAIPVAGAATAVTEASEDSEALKIDKTEIQAQVNEMLAKAGIDVKKLPPEAQAEIQAQQDKVFLKLQASPGQVAELEKVEAEKQLQEALGDLDLDMNNLPELSPKAKQEQIRFFKEFGIEEDAIAGNEQINQMWLILAAALPKMGVDPENLSPLLEKGDKQFDELRKQLKINAEPDTPSDSNDAVTSSENNSAPKDSQPIQPGDSVAGEDLSGSDFSNMDLQNCDFSFCILTGANFTGANLKNANFSNANLAQVNFNQSVLVGANLTNVDAKAALFNGSNCNESTTVNANFSDIQANDSSWNSTNGKNAMFIRAKLNSAGFQKAQLEGAEFESAELKQADFSEAVLKNATLERADAQGGLFVKADITGLRASLNANFSASDFSQCNGSGPIFSSANFKDSNLTYSDIPGAIFDNANLQMANLSASNLCKSRFVKANLAGAKFIQANLMQSSVERANLYQADLRGANCYEVEFFNAIINETNTESANLTATKLDT